jgi:hypothetical protein
MDTWRLERNCFDVAKINARYNQNVIKRLIGIHESKFQCTARLSGKLNIKILKWMKCLQLTERPKKLWKFKRFIGVLKMLSEWSITWLFYLWIIINEKTNNIRRKKNRSLLKLRVMLVILTLLNPKKTTKLPYCPPMLLERELSYKTTFIVKTNVLVSNYSIHYQIMNSVSIYSIVTSKQFINHSFRFLLLLIFASWCLPNKAPAVSQHISTPFSTVLLFNLSWWNPSPSSSETAPVFKKNPNGNAGNDVSLTCYTP